MRLQLCVIVYNTIVLVVQLYISTEHHRAAHITALQYKHHIRPYQIIYIYISHTRTYEWSMQNTDIQNPSERTGSFAGIHSRGVPSVTYSCTTSTTTSTTHTNGTLVHVRISTAVPVLADWLRRMQIHTQCIQHMCMRKSACTLQVDY